MSLEILNDSFQKCELRLCIICKKPINFLFESHDFESWQTYLKYIYIYINI